MSKKTKELRQYKGSDETFLKACVNADAKPTWRQYRKWLKGYGKAYAARPMASAA